MMVTRKKYLTSGMNDNLVFLEPTFWFTGRQKHLTDVRPLYVEGRFRSEL